MENASKALLIAGAILLVIAIIAIAMGILNQGQQVTTRAAGQFDALAVKSHNSQITNYTSLSSLTKTQAIELISTILSMNTQNTQIDGTDAGPFSVTITGNMNSLANLNGSTATFFTAVASMNERGIINSVAINER